MQEADGQRRARPTPASAPPVAGSQNHDGSHRTSDGGGGGGGRPHRDPAPRDASNITKLLVYFFLDGSFYSAWGALLLPIFIKKISDAEEARGGGGGGGGGLGESCVGYAAALAGLAQVVAALLCGYAGPLLARLCRGAGNLARLCRPGGGGGGGGGASVDLVLIRAGCAVAVAALLALLAALWVYGDGGGGRRYAETMALVYAGQTAWGAAAGVLATRAEGFFALASRLGSRTALYNFKWILQTLSYNVGYVLTLVLLLLGGTGGGGTTPGTDDASGSRGSSGRGDDVPNSGAATGDGWSVSRARAVLAVGLCLHPVAHLFLLSLREPRPRDAGDDDSGSTGAGRAGSGDPLLVHVEEEEDGSGRGTPQDRSTSESHSHDNDNNNNNIARGGGEGAASVAVTVHATTAATTTAPLPAPAADDCAASPPTSVIAVPSAASAAAAGAAAPAVSGAQWLLPRGPLARLCSLAATPYVVCAVDIIMAVGSGMSLPFFALFFIEMYHVSPLALYTTYILSTCLTAGVSSVMGKIVLQSEMETPAASSGARAEETHYALGTDSYSTSSGRCGQLLHLCRERVPLVMIVRTIGTSCLLLLALSRPPAVAPANVAGNNSSTNTNGNRSSGVSTSASQLARNYTVSAQGFLSLVGSHRLIILTLFVVRNSFMNSVLGITRSVVMDCVQHNNSKNSVERSPSSAEARSGDRGQADSGPAANTTRAASANNSNNSNSFSRWSALESVSSFSWSGSAALGGYIIQRHDYHVLFLATAVLHLCATVLLAPAAVAMHRRRQPAA